MSWADDMLQATLGKVCILFIYTLFEENVKIKFMFLLKTK